MCYLFIPTLLLCAVISVNNIDLCYGQTDTNYDFFQFENFGLNAETFVKELQMLKILKSYKADLEVWNDFAKSQLKAFKARREALIIPPISAYQSLKSAANLRVTFQRKNETLFKTDQEMKTRSKNFPQDSDVIGACRGLVILTDCYKLDPYQMVNGQFVFKGKVYQSPHNNMIVLSDLANMAVIASDMRYYDSSITFLKTVYELGKERPEELAVIKKSLDVYKNTVLQTHNHLLLQRKVRVGEDYKVFPYLVNSTLDKDPKQPKGLRKIKWFQRLETDATEYGGYKAEDSLSQTCSGALKAKYTGIPPKCHFLHHFDPYLKVGPFKFEVLLTRPYRTVFHDFLSETEIQHLINISIPNLSRHRHISTSNYAGEKHEYRSGARKITKHKTVQYWFNDIEYHNTPIYTTLANDPDVAFDELDFTLALEDPYDHTVLDPLVRKLSKKIEWATRTNVTKILSSSDYQTTNYGLAGLCETHVDPGSYVNTNSIIPYESRFIRGRGDIIATIMAWLGDVQAGGGTGFQYPDGEMLVEPIRGSAAFWIDLRANGNLEKKSSHGGCPVLMGNKWILNKWIYAFDQWRNYPCDLIKHTDIPPWNGITK